MDEIILVPRGIASKYKTIRLDSNIYKNSLGTLYQEISMEEVLYNWQIFISFT